MIHATCKGTSGFCRPISISSPPPLSINNLHKHPLHPVLLGLCWYVNINSFFIQRHINFIYHSASKIVLIFSNSNHAGAWIFFLTEQNSQVLPHSLHSLEILWETTTHGEDICHARLRHAGILVDGQEQDKRKNDKLAAVTALADATISRHRLYTAMNASLFAGLQLG